jgi:hypothetical protein
MQNTMPARPAAPPASNVAGTQAPVARPPGRTRKPVKEARPHLPPLEPRPSFFEWDLWTPEAKKGWAGSLAAHALLLVILACWYFAPRLNGPPSFDSRLAGSRNGVLEGELLTGGLNTPLPMFAAPQVETEVSLSSPTLAQLEFRTIEPEIKAGGAKSPSGGGGTPNNNPGAGDGDGFGLARFGDGGEVIRGVKVKVGDPQFTLIWNTDGVDLDLHVIEPGGKEIFWEEPKGKLGGELDVDNTKGFGPENVYWLVESDGPGSEKVKGPGPPGTYKWFVVYWGGFGGIAKPTHWQVRVKHAGQVNVYHGKFSALNERSKMYTLKVESGTGGFRPVPALPDPDDAR